MARPGKRWTSVPVRNVSPGSTPWGEGVRCGLHPGDGPAEDLRVRTRESKSRGRTVTGLGHPRPPPAAGLVPAAALRKERRTQQVVQRRPRVVLVTARGLPHVRARAGLSGPGAGQDERPSQVPGRLTGVHPRSGSQQRLAPPTGVVAGLNLTYRRLSRPRGGRHGGRVSASVRLVPPEGVIAAASENELDTLLTAL